MVNYNGIISYCDMLWDYVHFHKTLQYEQKLKKGGILKMKKLLTVLLVIAVMFTFSFGSAFAVAKADYNETLAKTYFDAAKRKVLTLPDQAKTKRQVELLAIS